MSDNHDDGKVVDIGGARESRATPDLHVECPRCGRSNFMRDTRCQHCGLWFAGEAFQFSPSESQPDRKRRLLLSLLWLVAAVAVILAIAAIRAL